VNREAIPWPLRLYGYALFGSTFTFIGSIYAAMLGWRLGAFVAVGAFGLRVCTDVVQGVIVYHRTMNRPWPKVPPLDDWDDD